MNMNYIYSINDYFKNINFNDYVKNNLEIHVDKINVVLQKANAITIDTSIGEVENPTKDINYAFININVFSKNPRYTLMMIDDIKTNIKHISNNKIPLYDYSDFSNIIPLNNHIRVRDITISQSNLKIDDYHIRNISIEYEEVDR